VSSYCSGEGRKEARRRQEAKKKIARFFLSIKEAKSEKKKSIQKTD
jgi:hypothetical protein